MNHNIIYLGNSQIMQSGFKSVIESDCKLDYRLSIVSELNFTNQHLNGNDLFILNATSVSESFFNKFMQVRLSLPKEQRKPLIVLCEKANKNLFGQEINGLIDINSNSRDLIKCVFKVLNSKGSSGLVFCNIPTNTESAICLKEITKRESEIIKLIVLGKSTLEISEILFNSTRTIDSHRRNIASKLDKQGPGKLMRFLTKNKNAILNQLQAINFQFEEHEIA